ncbi:ATP-binding protein [Devosia sp.]|uniref:sensor histidine kinase n=1 Tax=Devosia sp. TaxID=1871048 RepID=UPI003A8F9BB5
MSWLKSRITRVSPVSIAVAATAFSAASLFVVTDVIQLLGASADTGIMQMTASAGAPGPSTDATSAIAWRSGGAFSLALLVSGLAYRRREAPEPAPTPKADPSTLIAAMPFGVACWTAEGKLVACNTRFATRVGERKTLTPGMHYSDVVHAMIQNGTMAPVHEDVNDRLLELHRPDGATLLFEERPLETGGFVTLVMDVTESRRTTTMLASIREEQRELARRYHEEKLRAEAASRSKTSFLAHLSHDIRTPLNHIIGFADMLHEQPYGELGDARYLNYVEAVKGSGERLLGFFASILELAELEGGRRDLRSEQFTADDLLLTVLRRFSSQAQRAGLTLGLGGACHGLLNADRFALERMVGNLVDNALRFTARGGRVTLAAYAANDGVVLEITDTGIGMTEERLAALSQPFVFGDSALTRDREGSGLGIAISRAIAEASGGHLAIDSRQGLGTTVAVSLPLAEADAARAA